MSMDSEAAMAVAFFLSAASVCWSAAFAWSRWLQHRRGSTAAAPELDQRLDRIERAIDAVAIEVERLGEGQRFAVRLLSEAKAEPKGQSEPYRVNTPR
jgi:hypothetical protein